jgi:hypothetical protein
MFKSSLLVLMLIFSFGAFAKKGKIEVGVDLFPMGDFVGKAPLRGNATRVGGGFKADKIQLKLKKLKTGLELRDEHMLKYIEAKKYPKAVVSKAVCKGGKGAAVLAFKGKKKKVGFKCSEESGYLVADFKISAKAWGIKEISYKGIGVKDIIEIKAYVPIK